MAKIPFGGGGVVWEKERGGGGASGAKMVQKQKPLALTFTHTLLRREEGTRSGSLCLRTPEKNRERKQRAPKRGRRKNWERVSGGLKPANNSQDWNVQQQICGERKRRRAYQISWEMFYYESDWQKITNSCLHGRVSSCVTKSWCDPEKCKPQCSLQYSTEGHVSVSISSFLIPY